MANELKCKSARDYLNNQTLNNRWHERASSDPTDITTPNALQVGRHWFRDDLLRVRYHDGTVITHIPRHDTGMAETVAAHWTFDRGVATPPFSAAATLPSVGSTATMVANFNAHYLRGYLPDSTNVGNTIGLRLPDGRMKGEDPIDADDFVTKLYVDSLRGTSATTSVLVLDGDSRTQGGLACGADGYVNDLSTTETFTTYNVGIGGNRLEDQAPLAFTNVDPKLSWKARRNVVVIWAGVNDFRSGATGAQVYSLLSGYAKARRRAGWTVIVATEISARSESTVWDTQKNDLNALVLAHWSEFADGIAHLGGTVLGADGAYANATYFCDEIHLTTAGEAIVSSTISASINRLTTGDDARGNLTNQGLRISGPITATSFSNGGIEIDWSGGAGRFISYNRTTNAWRPVDFGSSYTTFSNSSVEVARIAGGNFGIGTTNPLTKFVVSNAGAEGLEIIPGYSVGLVVVQGYNRANSTYTSFDGHFSDYRFNIGASAEAIRILPSGDVGIGTATPIHKLSVSGTTLITGVITNSALAISKPVFTDASRSLVSTGTLGIDQGGTGVSLSDPGGHRLLGWDDTDNAVKFFIIGTGLSYDAGTDTLSSTGSGGTVTSVAATQPAAGFTIGGSPITTSGTFVFILADDLAAVEALSSTGLVQRTALNTWSTVALGSANQVLGINAAGTSNEYKTIVQASANRVTVAHAANSITLSLPQDIHTAATPTFGGMTITANPANLVVYPTAETGYGYIALLTAASLRKLEIVYVGTASAGFYGIPPGGVGLNAAATSLTLSTSDIARIAISSAGAINVPGLTASRFVRTDGSSNLTVSGASTIALTSEVSGILPMANGGTQSSLSDPGGHRLLGWDDTDGDIRFFVIGSGLSYDAATDTLSSSGGAGGGTVTSVDVTQPAAGFDITGGPITGGGTFVFTLDDDLEAVEAIATTGIVQRTAADTWSTVTLVPVASGGTGSDLSDPGGDRLIGWDNTNNDIRYFLIGTGLSYDQATDTLSATGVTQTQGNGIVISGTVIHFASSSAYTAGAIFYANSTTTVGQSAALNGIVQGNGTSAPSAITGTAGRLAQWSATAPYLVSSIIGISGQVVTLNGGDSTITSSGLLTLTATGATGHITLTPGGAGAVIISYMTGGVVFAGGGGGLSNSGIVDPAQGGTGFSSYAVGDILYADTTTTLARLADVATGQVLHSGGVGVAPSYSAVHLVNDTTGILSLAKGGTGFSLSVPTAHRLLGWDNTDGDVRFFTIGAGLLYTPGTDTLSATATGTVTSVSANQPAAGFTIVGSPITGSGAFTFALSDDLGAVESLSTVGVVLRTGTSAWSTVSGTANTMAKWGAGGTTLANSIATDDGTTITITSIGSQLLVKPTAETDYGYIALNDAANLRRLEIVYVGTSHATLYGITAGNVGINAGSTSFTLSTSDTARIIIASGGAVSIPGAITTSALLTGTTALFTGSVTSGGLVTGLGVKITGITVERLLATDVDGVVVPVTAGTGVAYDPVTQILTATGTGGTVTSVAVTVPSGLAVSGTPITTSGTFAFTLNDDLAAVEAMTGTGVALRTGASAWGAISGTANKLVKWGSGGVTLADGIATDDGSTITVAGGLTVVAANGLLRVRPSAETGYGIYYLENAAGARKFEFVYVGTGAASAYGIPAGQVGFNAAQGVLNLSTLDILRWSIDAAGTLAAPATATISVGTGRFTLSTLAGNGDIFLTTHGTGKVNVNSLSTTALVAADGSKYLKSVAIGSGITYDGTTLAATGTGGTVTSITLTQPSAGLTISGSGVAITTTGSPTFALADDLAAVEGISGVGIVQRTASNTWAASLGTANQILGVNAGATAGEYKTLVGTTNQVTVTHGVGTVTFSLPQNIHTGASPTFDSLSTGGGIVAGGAVTAATVNVTGLTASRLVATNSGKDLISIVVGSGLSYDIGTFTLTATGGGGTPGGSANQVQYNDGAGGFAGSAGMSWDNSTYTLTLGTSSVTGILRLGNDVRLHVYDNLGTDSNLYWGNGAGNFTSGSPAYHNIGIGDSVLVSLTTGAYNVGLGYVSLANLTEGDANVGVGAFAGASVVLGDENVLIGYGADVSSSSAINRIAIGHSVIGAADNTCTIGGVGSKGCVLNVNAGQASATRAKVGGTIHVNTSAVGNVGTGADDLMAFSLPANTLAADGDRLVIRASGAYASNGNNKEIQFLFGATTLLAHSAAFNGGQWCFIVEIIRTGAATQQWSVINVSPAGGGSSFSTGGTSSETLSGSITAKGIGIATSNNDITQNTMTIEWHPVA